MNIFQKHKQTRDTMMRKTMIGAFQAIALLATVATHSASAQDGKLCFVAPWVLQRTGSIGGGSSDVFVVNANGTNATLLDLPPNNYWNYSPAYSADGSKIIFASTRNAAGTGEDGLNLWTMNADGSSLKRITHEPGQGIGFGSFNSDASRIVFVQGGKGIYFANADGSGKQLLVADNFQDGMYRPDFPSFHPNGNKILFSANYGEIYPFPGEIYTINLDGTGLTQLTDNDVNDLTPVYSPDGSKIAFSSRHIRSVGGQDEGAVYIMNADGTAQTKVPNTTGGFLPVFSPDGTRIAFAKSIDQGTGLYTIKLDGTGSKLVCIASELRSPPRLSWAPGDVPGPAIADIGDASVLEGNSGTKDMFFTVRLSKPSPYQADVDYVTANGTATGFYDYTRVNGTLHFAPGEQSKVIHVPIIGDTEDEPDETLFVRLSNGKNLYLGDDEAVGVIHSDEIPKAPSNISLTPTSETSGPGEARIFSAVYRDPNFTQDIASAMLRVGNNNSNSLRTQYNPATNKLYLLNDAGTAYLGGFAPGSANVITNKQGSLNCAATSVSRAGELLTVNWSLTPSSVFMGVHDLYLMVRDLGGLVDGWDDMGVWSITANLPPVNVSLTPDDVTVAAGSAQTLSAKYSDPNGADDLISVMLRVGDRNAGGLRGIYNPLVNKLYLLSDDGKSYLGGFAPGASQIISNSQGSLDCSHTSVSKSGNNLTVNWSFTLSSGYLGPHNVSLYARDRAGLVDSWEPLGIWH